MGKHFGQKVNLCVNILYAQINSDLLAEGADFYLILFVHLDPPSSDGSSKEGNIFVMKFYLS